MARLLIFILIVLGLGAGFAWLADRPGDLLINWQGQQIEMSLVVGAGFVVALIAAVLILWWIVSTLVNSPHLVRRHLKARRRDRGYQALSTGLIAAGAGDAVTARRMNKRTQSLLSARQEPLIHLLEAQTALIEGDHAAARAKFESMADDPETRALALRGLYLEARRVGADEAARHYVERAVEASPHLPWAGQAALEMRSREGDWDGALRLLEKQRMARIVKREEADRKKAVLLTARAMKKLDGDPRGARDDGLEAVRLAPGLVPAAVTAAKALYREDNLRKGSKVLEKAWRSEPHPEIAETYVRARIGDSVSDRLKRAEKLEAVKPNHIESLLVVARAALDAQQFTRAREKAEAAARQQSRESIYLLLADIEEAETGDQGRVRHWLAQAVRAPRDPAWTADGYVSEKWAAVSPVTGKLDAFEWRVPLERLAGPVEPGQLADAEQIDRAIRTLPPVREPAADTRTSAAEQPVTVDAEIVPPATQTPPPAPSEEPAPKPASAAAPEAAAPMASPSVPAEPAPAHEPQEPIGPKAGSDSGADAPKPVEKVVEAQPAAAAVAEPDKPGQASDERAPEKGNGAAKVETAATPSRSAKDEAPKADFLERRLDDGNGSDSDSIPKRPPDDPGIEDDAAGPKKRFGLF